MVIEPIEILRPRSLKYLTKNIQDLIKGKLWLKVIIGMVLGIAFGALINPSSNLVDQNLSTIIGNWVVLPGKFFLTMVQMIVVPLVFASVIRGIAANRSVKQLKHTGFKLALYFLITTLIAAVCGILLATVFKPGNYVNLTSNKSSNKVIQNVENNVASRQSSDIKDIPTTLIELLPSNPLSDAVEANMLQIVLFSLIVGLALIQMKPSQARPLLDLLGSIMAVSMTIVRWVMILAPFAVFGLIAQVVIETGFEVFLGIGVYVGTIVLGLIILMLFYLAVAFSFGGWNPLTFISRIREAQLLAFSTDSSAATMPLSLKVVEERLKVRPSIAQFVIPLGATVNMNATALFQGLTTVFFTQVYNLELSLGTTIVLILTIIGSSVGAPATPGVGVIVLAVVLSSVGIPLQGLALIIGVDQILSRFRAMLNVTGDLVASVVMNRQARLEQPTYEEEIAAEHELEKHRHTTGEDVVI